MNLAANEDQAVTIYAKGCPGLEDNLYFMLS